MKQAQMYVRTLEEFIPENLHVLLELRYCMAITLVFIQSQQWMRNVRDALNTSLTGDRSEN